VTLALPEAAHGLDAHPSALLTQPWRLWTSAWVHWTTTHLVMDVLGVVGLGLLGGVAGARQHDTWAWFIAWPLSVGMAVGSTRLGLGSPPIEHLGGLSGWLHAGAVILALRLIASPGRAKVWGGAALMLLVLRVGFEWSQGAVVLNESTALQVFRHPSIHAAGLVAGALALALTTLLPRRWRLEVKPE
jgi:hypothetical protein